jgi:hypothetical protein
LAVATRVITPAQLPPSCSRLKRPDQLMDKFESWTISWSDTPMKHKRTGLIRFVPWLAGVAQHTLEWLYTSCSTGASLPKQM